MINLGKLLFPDFPRDVRRKKLRTLAIIVIGSMFASLLVVIVILEKSGAIKQHHDSASGITQQ
jgi:hypothetical protein